MSSSTDVVFKEISETEDCPSEVYCVQFSPDGDLVAAGCGDGVVRVYGASTGSLFYQIDVNKTRHPLPVTSLRFRPSGVSSKSKNVLLVASTDGSVQHWHLTSGKQIHEIMEKDNQVYCVTYNQDGSLFATAGKDFTVRVYDEATKSEKCAMEGGHGVITAGHANRVFSVKFCNDENLLITGGWDNTIQIWDMRVGHAIRSIYGPHICGDSIDINGNTVLSGSYRQKDPIQLWDFETGKLLRTIQFPVGASSDPCMIYSAEFSHEEKPLIVAGGSGANECKIFDSFTGDVISTLHGFEKAVFACTFSPDNSRVAVGGAEGEVRVFESNRAVVAEAEED